MSDSGQEAQLEIIITDGLDGRDLAAFELLDQPGRGYQIGCRNCRKKVWVGKNGLVYSLLGE